MSSMTEPLTPGEQRATLLAASLATLLVLIDFTTVTATGHETARALGGTVAWQTWALSSMSLGLAAGLLTGGALADDLGRRRVLLVSVTLLALTTAGAAAAPSMFLFVGARILQGVAGAGALAASLGLVGHAFAAGPERTRATGIWGAMVGGGIAAGPLIAALLALPGNWRTAYWAEAALALGLLVISAPVRESRSHIRHPVDLPGALSLSASMSAITAGFVTGRQSWTSSTTIVLLAGGVALLTAFTLVELRRDHPMLDLGLLRRPAFVATLTGAFVTGISLIALMSYLQTFTQLAMGLSVLGAATLLAAWSGTSTVVAWHARRLPDRLHARHRMSVGLVVSAAGLLGLTALPVDAGWARLLPGLLIAGVGVGLTNAALGRMAVASVPAHQPGMGSGATNTARYLGGAAGVALVVALATGGSGPLDRASLIHGWNTAALVTAILAAAGAAIIALCRDRVTPVGAPEPRDAPATTQRALAPRPAARPASTQ